MKKAGILIIIVILVIEVVLFVRLLKWNSSGNVSDNLDIGSKTGAGEQLSSAIEQVESLKKELSELRIFADSTAQNLRIKEQELKEAIKARDILKSGVTARFEEYEKKATEIDNIRKSEIAELNKKIITLNSEKTSLAAKMDEELKKRDATIEQIKKASELSEKILNEERQLTANLRKQLDEQTAKVKTLSDQISALSVEKENLKKELEAEKKKNADLTAENEALKKGK